MIKKFSIIIVMMSMCVTMLPIDVLGNFVEASSNPSITLKAPQDSEVECGDNNSFNVLYSDSDKISKVTLKASDIILNGFTATISIQNSRVANGIGAATIILKNIQGTSGKKYITIKSGTATDKLGNAANGTNSIPFEIITKQIIPPADTKAPNIQMKAPQNSKVEVGEQNYFNVTYTDNTKMGSVTLNKNDIILNGFTADINVINVKINNRIATATIVLTNIQGTAGLKNITIKSGTATDISGNTANGATSIPFEIITKQIIPPADTVSPSIQIKAPQNSKVEVGEQNYFNVIYTDNTKIGSVTLNKNDIILNGFTADINVINVKINNNIATATIALKNIQGTAGLKNITIKSGSATDEAGNIAGEASSEKFELIDKTIFVQDNIKPTAKVYLTNPKSIYIGNKIVYEVYYEDNVKIDRITLNKSDINLNGFTADINVYIKGNKAEIVLSNVYGTTGFKGITINSNTAVDKNGNYTDAITNIEKFYIKKSVVIEKPEQYVVPEIKDEVVDMSDIGTPNIKLDSFGLMLTSKKENTSLSQENNYITKNSNVKYVIDYYNGYNVNKEIIFVSLEMPKGVIVKQISGNGVIKTQNIQNTTITWTLSNVAAKQIGRLYVEVEYLEDLTSENYIQDFLVTADAYGSGITDEYTIYQRYINDKFIDQNDYEYYDLIDPYNIYKNNNEITNVEFIKLMESYNLLANKEVTELVYSNVPMFIELYHNDENIVKYLGKEIKSDNPILNSNLIEMIAEMSVDKYDEKINNKDLPFIYKEVTNGADYELSMLLMNLIERNIISRNYVYNEKYITKKDATNMLNALSMYGPYEIEDKTDIEVYGEYFVNIRHTLNKKEITYSKDLKSVNM